MGRHVRSWWELTKLKNDGFSFRPKADIAERELRQRLLGIEQEEVKTQAPAR